MMNATASTNPLPPPLLPPLSPPASLSSPPPIDYNRYDQYDRLLPDPYDVKVFGNVTVNDVAAAVVGALDRGPAALGPKTTAFIALMTPFVVALAIATLCCCRRKNNDGCGYGCFWYIYQGGCCRPVSPLAGMTPHTGLQPDEVSFMYLTTRCSTAHTDMLFPTICCVVTYLCVYVH